MGEEEDRKVTEEIAGVEGYSTVKEREYRKSG